MTRAKAQAEDRQAEDRQAEDRGRLAELDGLRGIAACGVSFLYHPLLEFSAQALGRVPAPLLWFRSWGWTFVDLFFLISGYVFAQVYLRGGRFDAARLPDFAAARLARLYPLHLLMLLVSALVLTAPGNTWYAFVAHLFMLQAFVAPVGQTFDGPSWSLSVEAFCYAIFAVAAARGDRVLRRIGTAAIVLALGYLILLGGQGGGPWAGDCLPRGLLGFFLGQVLWRARAVLARVPGAVLLALMALGLAIDMGDDWTPLPPLCLLAWPCALVLALRLPVLRRRALVWLGDRSYAIYLIHYPILKLLAPRLNALSEGWAAGAFALVFAATVLVLSDIVHRCFEVPARDALRGAWQRRRRAPAPGAVAA